MMPADPALFARLTPEENRILSAHLNSGWYKQDAVYPGLSEPWLETEALLKDLSQAHHETIQARLAARKELQGRITGQGQRAPEAGQ